MNKKTLNDRLHLDLDLLILPSALLIVVVFLGIMNPGKFLSVYNLTSMMYQIPELGLFTFAMMIAMITGGINLSIISSANLTTVIMALMMTKLLPDDMSNVGMAFSLVGIIAVGVIVSALLGLINGLLIAYVRTSAIMTTIGTMILYEGITLAITKGYVISGYPDMFMDVGNETFLSIPLPFYLFLFATLIIWIILRRRPFGRYLFYIGSNAEAVNLSGINVKKVIVSAYILSSIYAGFGGIIMLSRLGSANARYGSSYLLLSVLLSVLGGTDPDGGFGKIFGVFIGLFTLQSLSSGFNLMNINNYVTVALWGVMLLAVIYYRRYAEKRRNNWLMKKIDS